jgi:hypothetical protein
METFGIGFQNNGGVEVGIERDRNKAPIGESGVRRQELLLDFFEVAGHAGTKVREGATGKDERDRDGLAFELFGAERLPEMIGEVVFGQQIADLQRIHVLKEMIAIGWREIREADRLIGFDFPNLIDPGIIVRNAEPEGNCISRLQTGQFIRMLRFEGHGHPRHVDADRRAIVGDRLMPDFDSFTIGFQPLNCAFDLEGLGIGRTSLRLH